jgi:hypothetical protein
MRVSAQLRSTRGGMRRPGGMRGGMRGLGATATTISAATTIPCLPGTEGPLQPGQVFCGTGTTDSPSCLDSATGPLQAGQVFCATGTTTSPTADQSASYAAGTSPVSGMSTSTIIMAVAGVAIFAFVFLGNGGKS